MTFVHQHSDRPQTSGNVTPAPNGPRFPHLPEPPAVAKRQLVPRWVLPLVVGGGALAACVYTVANDPNTEKGIFPGCPFKAMTGLDCPGCGMTRGVYALLQGDPIGMVNHNLLLLIVLPVVLYTYLRWSLASFGFDRLPALAIKQWQSNAVLGVFVTFWVVRNLPGPLSFLDAVA